MKYSKKERGIYKMEQNKINEMFKKCINEAILSASQITGTDMYYKKAQVYSSIANALALTGQLTTITEVNNSNNNVQPKGSEDVMRDPNVDSSIGVIDPQKVKENKIEETVKEETEISVKKNSRESLKSKPVIQEVQEKVESLEDVEDTNDWSDIMLKKHDESLKAINEYTNKLGNKLIDGFVEQYSGGIYKNLEEGIKPMNIKGFVAYLDSMKEYIDTFVEVKEEYGEETLNECVSIATNGNSTNYEDITADVFVDFVKYIISCLSDCQKSDE